MTDTNEQQLPLPESSKATESHKYVIKTPSTSNDVVLQTTTEDIVDASGVTRLTTHEIVRASCCGALCTYSTDTRNKPPAGRCPSCGSILCALHLAQEFRCHVCPTLLCRACARPYGDVHLCATHYNKIQKRYEEARLKCLEAKTEKCSD